MFDVKADSDRFYSVKFYERQIEMCAKTQQLRREIPEVATFCICVAAVRDYLFDN